jgi:hypothetical protein
VLHQILGDDAGGDTVDWMHQADASRVELRELNDLNFARTDGRISALEVRMDTRFAATDAKRDALFAATDAKRDALFSPRWRHGWTGASPKPRQGSSGVSAIC